MLWCSLPGFPGVSCSFPFSSFSLSFLVQQKWLTQKGTHTTQSCSEWFGTEEHSGSLTPQATSALAASFCNLSCSDKWLRGKKKKSLPSQPTELSSQAPCFVHSSSCQWRCVQKQNWGLAVLTIHSCWAETSATAPLISVRSCQLCACKPFNAGISLTEHSQLSQSDLGHI